MSTPLNSIALHDVDLRGGVYPAKVLLYGHRLELSAVSGLGSGV